jgi:benzoyl-CoA reductase/2-hydroxyglutaryl-CoA dehydratase subunit BcrC/BadD/HgdB
LSTRKKILYLSNYIPEEIVDVYRFNTYLPAMKLDNYCTMVLNYMSQIICDDTVDGALIPNTCDSVRVARDILKTQTRKFVFQLKHPLKLSINSIIYYATQIKKFKEAFEKHFEVKITEDEILHRIKLIREKMQFLRRRYEYLAPFSYYEYLKALNQSHRSPLEDWRKILDIKFSTIKGPKKVFLIGPYLTDLSIVQMIEKYEGNIVGDDLSNSKRYFFSEDFLPHMDTGDLYESIAIQNLSRFPSPTSNRFNYIIVKDIDEIVRKGVKGVFFLYQKFCEPHQYIYPLLREGLEEKGISTFLLQLENKEHQAEIFENRIQNFMEMI